MGRRTCGGIRGGAPPAHRRTRVTRLKRKKKKKKLDRGRIENVCEQDTTSNQIENTNRAQASRGERFKEIRFYHLRRVVYWRSDVAIVLAPADGGEGSLNATVMVL